MSNPAGLLLLLGITTVATLLIWFGGYYQANKSGLAFGMKAKTWTIVVLGGHIVGVVSGFIAT